MKNINKYQKIILLLYGIAFLYFSIIHVPFKTNSHNKIKYDTLFSDSSNLDISRLLIIIVILSILTAILFLIFRNVNYSYNIKPLSKRVTKILIYTFLGIGLIFIIIFSVNKFRTTRDNIKIVKGEFVKPVDSVKAATDPTTNTTVPPLVLKAFETCTKEHALENFNSYMKFYYPDWKIYGKPVIKEQSDCTYRIQFTTLDPHIRYEREVIIVEISYNYDYSKYTLRTIRGYLY